MEREETFREENNGRFPNIQDIKRDKDWRDAQLRFDELTSRGYVSQLVGPDLLASTKALSPLRSFEVERKFDQLVRDKTNMEAVERAFQKFAQEASSAELNQHISTRRKEHSKSQAYFLTREGLRKVRSHPTPIGASGSECFQAFLPRTRMIVQLWGVLKNDRLTHAAG